MIPSSLQVAVVRGGGKFQPWSVVEADRVPEEEREEVDNGKTNDHLGDGCTNAQSNIIYYKVTNRNPLTFLKKTFQIGSKLWYYLFRLGSELGGEELLGLYFFFWMLCLDRCVAPPLLTFLTLPPPQHCGQAGSHGLERGHVHRTGHERCHQVDNTNLRACFTGSDVTLDVLMFQQLIRTKTTCYGLEKNL